MNKRHLIVIFVLTTLLFAGCGYTTGSLLPSHIKTIYIENFKNKIDISDEPSDKHGYRIYRVGLENEITEKIIDQFIFDGHIRIVDKDDADIILEGELLDYYKQPLRYDKFDNVEEYRIIVTVNLEATDIVKGKRMWKETNFIGFDTYRLTGGFARSEQEAQDGAIDDLSKKIVEKVVEGW